MKSPKIPIFPVLALLILVSCTGNEPPIPNPDIPVPISPAASPSSKIMSEDDKSDQQTTAEVEIEIEEEDQVIDDERIAADIISVTVSGNPEQYQFSVEVSSPDTGCEQYADWWEILDESGNLIYRRILLHSHVTDQPFTRSGGPVEVGQDTVVILRAHMNQAGYGGISLKGTAKTEFTAIDLPPDFAPGVEKGSPLPGGCNF